MRGVDLGESMVNGAAGVLLLQSSLTVTELEVAHVDTVSSDSALHRMLGDSTIARRSGRGGKFQPVL